MSLTRKVRKVGSSLIITIPSHLADAYGIKEGSHLHITASKDGKIILEKR